MSDTSPITKDSLESRRIKGTAAFLFLDYGVIIYSIGVFVNAFY